MAVGEEAVKALKAAIERQKAAREATAQVAADIAARQAGQETKTEGQEVKP